MKFYRINERIQALELRVIDADGTPLGVLKKEEALAKAQERELDLIEVAQNAKPPVARIVDFQKFRYQEERKEQAARKHAQEIALKEIWLSPRIAEHDLGIRLKKAQEFIGRGDRVKLTIRFKGREMTHPEVGHQVLNHALGMLGEKIGIEREARFEGRNLSIILSQPKGKSHAETKDEKSIS